MKEEIIEVKTKIVALDEVFNEYELKDIFKLQSDLFVYSYAYESYDGSGFAAWKKGKEWFYTSLSHCSCDGPTSNISMAGNAAFTFEQLKEIATKENYDNHALNVVTYIEEKKLNV